MRGRRLWIKAQGDGFRIYEKPSADDHYALYDETTGNIEVATNTQEVMENKLCHELTHKSFHGMSTEDATRIFGECYDDELQERQEELCLFLEKTLFPMLRRNGWLKFPKPPSQKKGSSGK